MKTKDTHWFSHDQNAFNDRKIELLTSKYGYAGYGRWWHLVEILRGEAGYKYPVSGKYGYVSLAKKLNLTLAEANEFVVDLIEYELLKTDEFFIWSDSLNGRMEYWESSRRKYSNMGKKSAENKKLKKSTVVEESVNTVEENGNLVATQLHNFSTNETKLNETKQNDSEEKKIDPSPSSSTLFCRDILLPLETLYHSVLQDQVHFVDPICMQYGIDTARLKLWLDAFNAEMNTTANNRKTVQDYRRHFINWLRYRDVATGDTTNWKEPPRSKKAAYATASPPANPTIDELRAMRAAEEAKYLNRPDTDDDEQ